MAPESPPRYHRPELDGHRGLAILLVFLFHALAVSFPSDHVAWAGWHRVWPIPLSFFLLMPAYLGKSGVAIFFVVSGFCIHVSHQRARDRRWPTFFARRFFRVYPPYLAALLFFALAFPPSRLGFNSRHDLDQLLTHLLLLHNDLGPAFIYGINPALWSIGTEAQLYLLYPILLLAVQRLGWSRALWMVGALEIVLRSLSAVLSPQQDSELWVTGNPLTFGLSWSLGAWLADDFLNARRFPLSGTSLWFWPSLAAASYFIRPLEAFSFLLWALTTVTILSRVLAHEAPGWTLFLSSRTLGGLGTSSYSVYLLHQPLLSWAASEMRPALHLHSFEMFVACVLTAPAILFISWLFYLLVEKPSIAYGKLLFTRARPAPVNPAITSEGSLTYK